MIINTDRLWNDLMELSDFTDEKRPWTRRSFSEEYIRGRKWLIERMEKAGLKVEVDAAANIIGRREGKYSERKPIIIGSHTDTVPNGGRFDGITGVLAGLEVLRVLEENNIVLDYPIELVDFTAEEPSSYGLSTIGSRVWSGNLTNEMLQYRNKSGESLSSAISRIGGQPNKIFDQTMKKDIEIYLELHIEQGRVLEQNNITLGVVTGIVGIERYEIVVKGLADHAGTTPMNIRADALAGAAEMVKALEMIVNEQFEEQVVGTVGELSVTPNASNVIPGKVKFSVEIRSISKDVIGKVRDNFFKKVNDISEKRNLAIESRSISQSDPVLIKKKIVNYLTESCYEVSQNVMHLPSGAGHDANQISELGPVGMIFIPCREGKSHCPEEWVDKEVVAQGANVLLKSVLNYSKIVE